MGRKLDIFRGRGQKRISWAKAIGISLSGIIISYVIFMMAEVFWADLLRTWFASAFIGDIYTTPLLILTIGIIISLLISILIFLILLKSKKLKVPKATIFMVLILSFLCTFSTILFLCFFTIEIYYYEVFSMYTFIDKIIIFPQYIAYYAIYILESPVILWDITAVIYGIFMLIFIKLIIREYTPKKKIKPAYGGVL